MAPITNILLALFAATSINALPTLESRSTAPSEPGTIEFASFVKDSPTAISRFQKLFTKDEGDNVEIDQDLVEKTFKFDFNKASPAGEGGRVLAANVVSFPVLTDLGISTTVAELGPCGTNTPHVHPRATEFLTVVGGDGLEVGMIVENGLVKKGPAEVKTHLSKLQGTVFPVGSIHYQFNRYCRPTTFVATLNSEDPGTGQVAQNFFGLNQDVVSASLGWGENVAGVDVASLKEKIPANLARDVGECLARCKDQIAA